MLLQNMSVSLNFNTYELSCLVKIQSLCRGWIVRRKNIYGVIKKFKRLQESFSTTLHGYHMVNSSPIKESVWEEVNCDIVKSLFSISDEAKGNHASGKDNRFDNIDISNKSAKVEGTNINISSYRLTTVCNARDIGTSEKIIEEIRKRDSSFDYYSLLVRHEKENSQIEYMWYIVPKDYYIFRIDDLNHKIGKRGVKKGEIVGWESKYSSITFSMSSQLWYNFDINELKKYMVCSTKIDNGESKINYSQIFKSFSGV